MGTEAVDGSQELGSEIIPRRHYVLAGAVVLLMTVILGSIGYLVLYDRIYAHYRDEAINDNSLKMQMLVTLAERSAARGESIDEILSELAPLVRDQSSPEATHLITLDSMVSPAAGPGAQSVAAFDDFEQASVVLGTPLVTGFQLHEESIRDSVQAVMMPSMAMLLLGVLLVSTGGIAAFAQVSVVASRRVKRVASDLRRQRDSIERDFNDRAALLSDLNRRLELQVERERGKVGRNLNFLANVSHELRTPLNAIKGFAELIDMEPFGPLGHPRYREYLQSIGVSTSTLVSVLDEVLDLAKINSGKRELIEANVELSLLLKQAANRAREDLDREIDVEFHGRPTVVLGDRDAMFRIFTGLINNAARYSMPQSPIDVCWSLTDSGECMITIKDEGRGIAESELLTLLEPFEQADAIVRKPNQGAGLGLPIALALTRLHGGSLGIESKLEQGTKVCVCLPDFRVIHEGQGGRRSDANPNRPSKDVAA